MLETVHYVFGKKFDCSRIRNIPQETREIVRNNKLHILYGRLSNNKQC